ncbi:MAG TPA: DUF2283 domain-containing protein [Thermodesulfobacteriota bacterium]|nr:DUF2283 domain-containing protein [Thermodesulfobacteriota bacterium]
MKLEYDREIDALYSKLGNQKPDGVIEISEGVNLDTTHENKIVGIEILMLLKNYVFQQTVRPFHHFFS